MSTAAAAAPQEEQSQGARILDWVLVVVLIYLLLLAVGMIGTGFKTAAGDHAKDLFAFATNPFTGLVIGIVSTALIQSSSTVTSIIVGLVAGGLPVGIAIPMVMGANVGTSVTNTLVSLGHVRKGEEFQRAFAAATIHDFFNLLAVAIFLPLEIIFHPLQKTSSYVAHLFLGTGNMSAKGFNFMGAITKPPVDFVGDLLGFLPQIALGVTMIVLGILMIFFVVTFIGKLLRTLMVGRAKAILHHAVGRGPLSGITSGTIMTVLVQSSSTTTSLIVPLAGTGVFTLRQVYPFTLGANIGTTITALLAATAITGANAVFALQIALVHLFYNLFAVIVIYGIPFLRQIPIFLAETLAAITVKHKFVALAYILGVFFLLPGLLIYLTYLLGL